MQRHFGSITGVLEGAAFTDRQELHDAKVHLPIQAGISGSSTEGADSIVLSGGYEDDCDEGDVIIYTGEGGRDASTGKQVKHQELVRGNRALAVSHRDGLPVRVTRGSRHASSFSPRLGYQYAGLYQVDDHWQEIGKSGFRIWRFRLIKIIETSESSDLGHQKQPKRQPVIIQRIVRDTQGARAIKSRYDYRCQVCNERLDTGVGAYAEAAHIRPLGAPHHGPDTDDNLLCLCPNHHVLFDFGAFTIGDDFELLGISGKLNVHPQHRLNPAHLAYHRSRYGQGQ